MKRKKPNECWTVLPGSLKVGQGEAAFLQKGLCIRITSLYSASAYCRNDNLVECSDFLYNNKGIVVG